MMMHRMHALRHLGPTAQARPGLAPACAQARRSSGHVLRSAVTEAAERSGGEPSTSYSPAQGAPEPRARRAPRRGDAPSPAGGASAPQRDGARPRRQWVEQQPDPAAAPGGAEPAADASVDPDAGADAGTHTHTHTPRPPQPRPPKLTPQQLTGRIMAAKRWQELRDLHHDYSRSLDPIALAAMATRLPKLVPGQGLQAQQQAGQAQQGHSEAEQGSAPPGEEQQPQRGQRRLSREEAGEVERLFYGVCERLRAQAGALGGREWANVLWALAKLGMQPAASVHAPWLVARLEATAAQLKPQEVSNVLYALALLLPASSPAPAPAPTPAPPTLLPPGQQPLPVGAAAGGAPAPSTAQPGRLARLCSEAFVHTLAEQLLAAAPMPGPGRPSRGGRGGRGGGRGAAGGRGGRAAPGAPGPDPAAAPGPGPSPGPGAPPAGPPPQALVNALWALERLGYRPSPEWLTRYLAACDRFLSPRPRPPGEDSDGDGDRGSCASAAFTPQGLSLLIWLLGSRLALRPLPRPWALRFLDTAAAALPAAGPQALANILRGLVDSITVPPAPWLAAALRRMAELTQQLNPQDTSACIWAAAKFSPYSPPSEELLEGLLARSYDQLPEMQPEGLAATIAGLAVLGRRPSRPWAERFLGAAYAAAAGGGSSGSGSASRPAMPPMSCVQILWGTAMLGFKPRAKWVGALLGALGALPPGALNGHDVKQLLQALAALKPSPELRAALPPALLDALRAGAAELPLDEREGHEWLMTAAASDGASMGL